MRLLLILVTVLLTVGCASQPHRLRAASTTPCDLPPPVGDPKTGYVWEKADSPCSNSWAVRFNGPGAHGVNYVEIDEQGILRDRNAAEEALRFAGESQGNRPAYVVVYIHGWFHDAAAEDENVQAFHSALASVRAWHEDRDVRGIFIGWRGGSIQLPLLRYLTFWERKSTSEEVGRGGLLEFLLRLEQAVKPTPDSRNRLILVGHSFGASVAFNSLAHVFLERFLDGVQSTATRPRFRGYGDLVVLINPAIEAMRYMPFQSAIRYYSGRVQAPKADFTYESVPRLVVLSSLGDWATRRAFPFARVFSTLLEEHQSISSQQSPDPTGGAYDEWDMDTQTVGNYGGFHTHTTLAFALEQEQAAARTETRGRLASLEACRNLSAIEIRDLLFADAADLASRGRTFPDSSFRLAWAGSMPKYMPYILVDVDKQIIADHSDIGHASLICWINQLADAE